MPSSLSQPAAGVVSRDEMQRIFEEVKTPFKYGIVLHPPDGKIVDCPSVFRFGGRWYMIYVQADVKVGYETMLASSDDLLHWTESRRIRQPVRENAGTPVLRRRA